MTEEIIRSDANPLKKRLALKEAFEGFVHNDDVYRRIKQLLKEAHAAKDKGQWGKAETILWEVRRITRVHGRVGAL